MAIFHCQCQIIKRSDGRSAVAAAAYRAGEKLVDERTGETHDFRPRTHTTDIVAEVFLPDGSPETLKDRATLWNQIEKIEKRKNSQLCREFDVALPVELSRDQQIELAQEFARSFTETERVAADLCCHFGDPQ
ncbi:MAG: MobA/MobL family protein, partial [Pyramidobacter sp.]|nr:MobA/MobL family protein [Pyramidobacter sp.]